MKPKKRKPKKRDFWGFDVETYGVDNTFYQGSITKGDKAFIFFDRALMGDFMMEMQGATFSATNLAFDFFALYQGTENEKKFLLNFRKDSSELLFAKYEKVEFIDTLNYVRMGVEKLGNLLNIPKHKKPDCITEDIARMPKNEEEWSELIIYNIRDSKISEMFLSYVESELLALGGEMKITIGSSFITLYRIKYLDKKYYQGNTKDMEEIRNAYYGGRTEVFRRGIIKRHLRMYDINSMYPFVMRQFAYPNPNSKRVSLSGDIRLIYNFPGVSHIKIHCPKDMDIPLLPLRLKSKLIFPTGTLIGWYAHNEILEALKEGYVVEKIYKTHYYKESCRPFQKIVDDLYTKRLYYKQHNDSREHMIKLLLNSGSGKWGQRFGSIENVRHVDTLTKEDIEKYSFDEIGRDYVKFEESRKPQQHCFPVWACYITAYARIYLHRYLKVCKAYYCDTDSLIIEGTLPTGDKLGMMKLEHEFNECVIIKPKYYMIPDKIKIKGIGKEVSEEEFMDSMKGCRIEYFKFSKFRESKRRNHPVNRRIELFKKLNLEDNKRLWTSYFNGDEQVSRPIHASYQEVIKEEWKESIIKTV